MLNWILLSTAIVMQVAPFTRAQARLPWKGGKRTGSTQTSSLLLSENQCNDIQRICATSKFCNFQRGLLYVRCFFEESFDVGFTQRIPPNVCTIECLRQANSFARTSIGDQLLASTFELNEIRLTTNNLGHLHGDKAEHQRLRPRSSKDVCSRNNAARFTNCYSTLLHWNITLFSFTDVHTCVRDACSPSTALKCKSVADQYHECVSDILTAPMGETSGWLLCQKVCRRVFLAFNRFCQGSSPCGCVFDCLPGLWNFIEIWGSRCEPKYSQGLSSMPSTSNSVNGQFINAVNSDERSVNIFDDDEDDDDGEYSFLSREDQRKQEQPYQHHFRHSKQAPIPFERTMVTSSNGSWSWTYCKMQFGALTAKGPMADSAANVQRLPIAFGTISILFLILQQTLLQ